jgi:hypothetical protein
MATHGPLPYYITKTGYGPFSKNITMAKNELFSQTAKMAT